MLQKQTGMWSHRPVRDLELCVLVGQESGREGMGDLLAKNTPDILPKTPKRIRKKQHHLPADLFAHLVIAITPLFYR